MRYLLTFLLLIFSLGAEAKITARSFLVMDAQGEVLAEKNAYLVQPIASITKLMTAMVVLSAKQDLDEEIALNFRLSGKYHTRLPRYLKTLPRRELINLAMVKSDNFAAYTLCQNFPGGVDSCVTQMNLQASAWGLYQTQFADPTGLDPRNISSARDLAKLVMIASKYPEITLASAQPKIIIPVRRGYAEFGNTNPMVRMGEDILVSKTGYINSSGGCLAMLMNTAEGQRIVVVLGSRSVRTRVPEARQILAGL